jgi:hypothetical protein
MKKTFSYVCAGIVACVSCGTPLAMAEETRDADSQITSQTTQNQSGNQNTAFDYEQARKYLDVTGRQCRDADGRLIGQIDHVVAASPEKAVAQVGLGNGRYAMVPYNSLTKEQTRRGHTRVTVNSTAKQVKSGPTIAFQDWDKAEVSNPQFMQNLYAHYDSTDTAVGGTGASSSGGTITGSDASSSTPEKAK